MISKLKSIKWLIPGGIGIYLVVSKNYILLICIILAVVSVELAWRLGELEGTKSNKKEK